jgi:16S rRNA (cytosine967-C5)-methyltransferase
MSGNYRPRRRHGTPVSPKGQRDTASRAKPPRPADPRRTAYDVLKAVRDREAYANLLLPRLLAERRLAGRDAAFATELAYGTLRGQGTYDAVLAACSDRPLDKLDPPVLDILRLGAHQLLNTRVGAHAAVATSVDLAKSVAGPRVSGYVNAVLRRVATRDLEAWLDLLAPNPAADADGSLAVRYSHPRWIVAAYRDALGEKAEVPASGAAEAGGGAAVTELEAALAAGNARPRVTLAALPSGPSREDVMPAGAEPGRWSPYAFTLRSGDPAPLIESGAAVQDEGSQLAAIALSRVPVIPRSDRGNGEAERWLDMCAGPGGKSRLLYGLAQPWRATLTAADLHPHRASLVREALTRANRLTGSSVLPDQAEKAQGRRTAASPGTGGTKGFEVVVADGTRPPWPDGTFDRVLVDAPCSGLGALRRRPEARWRKSEADLQELTALQRDLLRSALKSVRPGGAVAYVTCSPVPAETSDVVADVAASTPGTEIIDAPGVLSEVPGARSRNPLFAQLWPHRHGTDAIFIALLRRGSPST